MFDLLRELCSTIAPSGYEVQLHDLIKREIASFVDEIYTDALGNLIAHKKGPGKKLMFCAHADEVGLVATCHGKEGQIYVAPLGGVSPYAALYQRVAFVGGAEGVVVPDGKEEELTQKLTLQNLYVDIGAKTEEEASQRLKIGECGAFCGAYREQEDCIISKALDDRAGCFVLIEAIRAAKKHQNDLYFVFTAGEELGLRGAKAVSGSVMPNYAIVIDVTRTGDTPAGPKMAVSLGKGVAVKIMDRSFLAHPIIKEKMMSLCEKWAIPYQTEVLEKGGTDAGAIHLSGGGVPSGCISIPTRYIHTPGEMIHAEDLKSAVALATALIEEGF